MSLEERRRLCDSSSEYAYRPPAQPKQLMIINDANHVDLYDRMDKIPLDKNSEFFGKNLKQESETTGAVTGASCAK